MKKLLFFLLLFGAMQAKAQVIKGSIELRDSTIDRTIPFEVPLGAKLIKYDVKVYADEGTVTVRLTDPAYKRRVNVTLGTKTSSGGHEPSKGELNDDNVTPKIPGTWKFDITSENATGKISYEIEVAKP